MPRVSEHPAGSFSWIELATNDQNAAKQFYTQLLGWTSQDNPMGPDAFYTMFQINGANVGAAYTLHSNETSAGIPPHWNLYITVADADETAKRAAELGGRVVAPPFDVYDFGRMAVIIDPTGAAFEIWQAKGHIGAQLTGENATLCWADLNCKDPAAARRFYGDLFGWTFDAGKDGYLHIKNGQAHIGGIPSPQQLPPDIHPHWMIYLQVNDCAASTAKAKELGGTVFVSPTPIENTGTFAILMDPQGAAFALFQPAPRA